MLGRSNRLRRRADIERVYKRGASVRSQDLGLRHLDNGQSGPRMVVVVGKKVSKKATVRNRIRRRLSAELKTRQLTQPKDILVSVYNDVSNLPAEALAKQLSELLQKSQLS